MPLSLYLFVTLISVCLCHSLCPSSALTLSKSNDETKKALEVKTVYNKGYFIVPLSLFFLIFYLAPLSLAPWIARSCCLGQDSKSILFFRIRQREHNYGWAAGVLCGARTHRGQHPDEELLWQKGQKETFQGNYLIRIRPILKISNSNWEEGQPYSDPNLQHSQCRAQYALLFDHFTDRSSYLALPPPYFNPN